jgi:hypothetical protein
MNAVQPTVRSRLPDDSRLRVQAISASTWRSAWYLICYLAMSWALFSLALTASVVAAVLTITVVARSAGART